RAKLEAEAADGRYLRRKAYPLLWDAQSNELLVGSTAVSLLDRLHTLFQQTFDRGFDLQGAGKLAYLQAEGRGQTRGVDDAIQAGKLPRKAGLTLVRHDHQYELTLHAETLAITGAKLPPAEADDERAQLEERVTLLRHLLETLDLLYDAFGHRRCGPEWPRELARLQKWLQREERGRVSATA